MVQNASMSSEPRHFGWMLVHEKMGIMWCPPGSNAQQAWTNAWAWDMVEGNGLWNTRPREPGSSFAWIKNMKSAGWRARRIKMEVT